MWKLFSDKTQNLYLNKASNGYDINFSLEDSFRNRMTNEPGLACILLKVDKIGTLYKAFGIQCTQVSLINN